MQFILFHTCHCVMLTGIEKLCGYFVLKAVYSSQCVCEPSAGCRVGRWEQEMEWILADPTHETSVGHKRRGYSTAAASPMLLEQHFSYMVNCICIRVAERISHHSVGGKKALEMPKWNKSRLFLLTRPQFYIKSGFS